MKVLVLFLLITIVLLAVSIILLKLKINRIISSKFDTLEEKDARMVVVISHEGVVIGVDNFKKELFFDIPMDSILKRNIDIINDVISSDNSKEYGIISSSYKKANETGKTQYFKYSVYHSDGKIDNVLGLAYKSNDNNVYISFVNLKEDKLVFVRKLFVNHLLNPIVDDISIGIYTHKNEFDDGIQYYNKFAQKIFQNESLPKSEFWDDKLEAEYNKKAYNSTSPISYKRVLKDKNGRILYWLKFTKYKIENFQGEHSIVTTIENISDYENEKLMSNEQLKILQMAFDASDISMWKYDMEENRFHTLRGIQYIEDNISYENFKNTCLENNAETFLSSFDEVLTDRNNKVSFKSSIHDTNTNETVFLNNVIVGIKNSQGEIKSLLGTQKNISDEINREIKNSNIIKSLDMAMDAGKIMAWEYDLKFKRFRVLYGTYIKDTFFDNIRDLIKTNIHPDYIQPLYRYIHGIISNDGETGNSIILKCLCSDGNYHFYEFSANLIKNLSGEKLSVVGVLKDVSEIYSLKHESQFNKGMINAMYKHLPLGICYFDKNGVLKDANDYILTMFNKKQRIDIVNNLNLFRDIYISDDNIKDLKNGDNINTKIKVDSSDPKCRTFIPTNVQNRIFELHIIALTDNDVVEGYLSMCSDITLKQNTLVEVKRVHNNLKLALAAGGLTAWSYNIKDRIFTSLIKDNETEPYSLDDVIKRISSQDGFLLTNLLNEIASGKKDKGEIIYKSNDVLSKYGYRYFETMMIGVRNINNEIIGINGSKKDITEDVIYKKMLEEYKSKMSLVIKSSLVRPWDYDPVNDLLSITHETEDSIKTRTTHLNDLLKNIHPDDAAIFESFSNILKHREARPYSIDVRYKNSDMEDWHYSTIAVDPYEIDKNGYCIRYSGYRRDNDRIYKLNREVRRYAEKIKNILDLSGIMSWDYNIKNDTVKIDISHHGIDSIEVAWSKYMKFVYKDDKDKSEAIHKILKNGEKELFSERIRIVKNEKIAYELINAICLKNEHGEIVGYTGLFRDITDLIEIQMSLEKETEKAQQADKLKSAFLANMSHEIRTPLNAIIGFSQLLQTASDDKEKQEYVNIINTNNDHLLRLINDILDLSKIESGMLNLKDERFDVSLFMDEFYVSMKQRINSEKVNFILDNPYKKCNVIMDKNRFNQLLTNFVTNAIKYTPSGFIKIGYSVDDNWIKIFVEDSGIGIKEDKQDKIFQRFEKLDDFAQGTGLGLSICKAIVDAKGGKIGFESKYNVGSTFWAALPLHHEFHKEDEVMYKVDSYLFHEE
ncbi:MAG: PAS domain-containing sensor histidine kinase [Bacteroidales bacterium]|nr:PAS domain-containing sensor histidine kinase [Bacteroidales bacterium]